MVVENSLERMDLDIWIDEWEWEKKTCGRIEFQHLMLLMRMNGG